MKFLVLFLSIAFVLATETNPLLSWYYGLDAQNVLYAVSCGSETDYTDLNGIVYKADSGFSTGSISADG